MRFKYCAQYVWEQEPWIIVLWYSQFHLLLSVSFPSVWFIKHSSSLYCEPIQNSRIKSQVVLVIKVVLLLKLYCSQSHSKHVNLAFRVQFPQRSLKLSNWMAMQLINFLSIESRKWKGWWAIKEGIKLKLYIYIKERQGTKALKFSLTWMRLRVRVKPKTEFKLPAVLQSEVCW